MSRRERLYIRGMPQLIQLKGHNSGFLFSDDKDYIKFIECLDNALKLYHCALHGYSLLPKKILLLITPETKEDLSKLIQYIGRIYVPFYNNKYHRSGSLWEGRYNSCLIEPGAYLLLTQKFVDSCEQDSISGSPRVPYRSSRACNVGDSKMPRITPHAEYLKLGKTPEQRAAQYRFFLQSPVSQAVNERILLCLAQNRVLGTPGYCQALEVSTHRNLRPRQSGRPRKYYSNEVADWVWFEHHAFTLLQRYCYQEIRLPLLEHWELQQEKQSFFSYPENDHEQVIYNNQALLRGEGTMGCLRFIALHQHLQSTSRLWYLGAMFRSSYPLKKHIEQYHQLGVEAFGYKDIDIELEQLLLQYDLFKLLQLSSHVELKVNTLGSYSEFQAFRQALQKYYHPFRDCFQPPWLDWLVCTPEKLLEIPDPVLRALNLNAPKLETFISPPSYQRFNTLIQSLSVLGIPHSIDTSLLPANDYCHTIFEWRADKLDENSLLCRGGRYDASASRFLDKTIYACGFAIMLEPLMQLIQLTKEHPFTQRLVDVVIIPRSADATEKALLIGQSLREAFPQLSVINDCSRMRIGTCQKNAFKQGARFVLMVSNPQSDKIDIIEKEALLCEETDLNGVIGVLSNSLNV